MSWVDIVVHLDFSKSQVVLKDQKIGNCWYDGFPSSNQATAKDTEF